MWFRSVAPWCTYDRAATYVSYPAPADWFIMTPRAVAQPTFQGVYEDYMRCEGDSFKRLEAACCGGGPTAQMVGGFARTRAPLIGMPWPGPGAPPAGSVVKHNLWPTLVMRDEIDNVLCKQVRRVDGG